MQDRFIRVPFISLSATSTTEFFKTFDRVTGNFTKRSFINDKGEEQEIKPPTFQKHKGMLSEKGKRNLNRSINNFLISINPDMLVNGTDKSKISFVTLTLPSEQIKSISSNGVDFYATDKEIKSKCFNQFLTEIKTDKGVQDFIWVCEKQLNGNLHFHLLVDKYIEFEYLQKVWNRIINKLGFVDRYAERMRKLSFDDYKELRKGERKSEQQLKTAYDNGIKNNWLNPNSVDIARLRKVENIAGYISKYMSKGFDFEDKKFKQYASTLSAKYDLSEIVLQQIYIIDGRIWQCSQKISRSRRCVEYLEESFRTEINKAVKEFEDLKVHTDEYFTTLCHSFKFMKNHLSNIYETFINHIKKSFSDDVLYNKPVTLSNNVVFSPVSSLPPYPTKNNYEKSLQLWKTYI